MKPWREVAIPHSDVLKGTFQQAEFAADISAVHAKRAVQEYQDARAFFERTYITEGMHRLLTQVVQRLNGRGGEPVIQLQTAFGGGKTHTMLAVLHLASRDCPLSDLAGVPTLVEQAGLMDIPKAAVAVLDGADLSPGQPWKHGRTSIRTLWGELAWQLGGADALALVKESDANGTSPGKEILRQLLDRHAPCVILIDELAKYVGQFEEGKSYSGGTYDSNLAFVQSLTEAVKLVPTAVLLASLPDSAPSSSGDRGREAIEALEHLFGRVQAIWRPVATEEAFEIVRRRLFEPVKDLSARDAVCRAFADAYVAEGAKLPAETQEGRYFDRLAQAYPIHPEVFDRLYEDWSSIETFQRTRGVLKLMAKVISRLWDMADKNPMILPGSLPLDQGEVRSDLTALLPQGWDPVIERDIDGKRAETSELEFHEPRFGQFQAARRVARTLFLGSAPSCVAMNPGAIRGLDRGRILLGCLQPGESSAVYSDALGRLADRLHYLNSSGDKAVGSTRYWFDTRANLRREMEDRKRRFDLKTDVKKKTEDVLKYLFPGGSPFEGVHVFTPHADVPDDEALRLVILPPETTFTKADPRGATEAVLEYLRSHGTQPRHRANRLLFLAPDRQVLDRLQDATRTSLAWDSIVRDVEEGRLNIDQVQRKQAFSEVGAAKAVVPRVARECFKWLLCPAQDDPTEPRPSIEAHPLNTTSSSPSNELARICRENELVIETWAPIHLRARLKEFYWKPDRPAVRAMQFWEDSLKYLFLPRLKSREVFAAAVRKGTETREFFGTAYGESDNKFEGLQLGEGTLVLDGSLLLIEPTIAARLLIEQQPAQEPPVISVPTPVGTGGPSRPPLVHPTGNGKGEPPKAAAKSHSFRGIVEIDSMLAKSRLNEIADEVLALLARDPYARVRITLEIDAEFSDGVDDGLKRDVSENAAHLKFKVSDWE